MRRSILALVVLAASTLAHADLAEEFQKINCGDKLSNNCRVVVAPKKVERHGYCVGTFMGAFPCVVSFISVKEGAAMNLTCGDDPENPVLNQDMGAEANGFNVAAIIKKADGQDEVRNDKNDYTTFSNTMVDVMLIESENFGVKSTVGTVVLSLQSGPVSLTNVTCN